MDLITVLLIVTLTFTIALFLTALWNAIVNTVDLAMEHKFEKDTKYIAKNTHSLKELAKDEVQSRRLAEQNKANQAMIMNSVKSALSEQHNK